MPTYLVLRDPSVAQFLRNMRRPNKDGSVRVSEHQVRDALRKCEDRLDIEIRIQNLTSTSLRQGWFPAAKSALDIASTGSRDVPVIQRYNRGWDHAQLERARSHYARYVNNS